MCKYAFWVTLAFFSFAQMSHANHRIIIKFKSDQPITVSSVNSNLKFLRVMPESIKPIAGGAYEMAFTRQKLNKAIDEQALLTRLNKRPDIEYAVINRRGKFKPLPKIKDQDPSLILSHDLQWDEFSPPGGMMLESVSGNLDGAWAYSLGDAQRQVVVAVLDTGIEPHPDLLGNVFFNEDGSIYGWNFDASNTNLEDETKSYHGTHVAGTIAGYGNVMQGVGPHLKILPLKIPAFDGMFYESNVINAIYWAAGANVPGLPKNDHKARVINMSFGVDEHPGKERNYCDKALQEAVNYARTHGVVVVAAAGNENHWEDFNAPAICSGVIRVASTGPTGLRSYFSNYGPSITFAAPGGDMRVGGVKGGILSTVNPDGGYNGSGYKFYQGTSMAAPHVAGLFALVDSASPGRLSVKNLEQLLYATTHDFGVSSSDNDSCRGKAPCGHGIIDALNAISAVSEGFTTFIVPSEAIKLRDPAWHKILKTIKPPPMVGNKSLWQTKQGKTYLRVNSDYYEFRPKAPMRCKIVGFDGVGCFING